jgi:hypothetical protein
MTMEIVIIKNLKGDLEAVTQKEYSNIPVDNKIGSIHVIEQDDLIVPCPWDEHMRTVKARALAAWGKGVTEITE